MYAKSNFYADYMISECRNLHQIVSGQQVNEQTLDQQKIGVLFLCVQT